MLAALFSKFPPTEEQSSSPVGKMNKHFAEHKRDEVQAFGYDEDDHQLESITHFMDFLKVPANRLPSTTPKANNNRLTFKNFIPAANSMARSIKSRYFANKDLLEFKSTRNQLQGGHVTDTMCKPDFIAAFMDDWGGEMPSSGHLNTTLWPCIRLVGEEGSKGKCPVYQKKQVISYLHFLLLARPDLHVAQGLFTSKSGVMFLFGIGGVGVRNFSVRWNSKELYKLMYAFVYRLYDPGDFVDSSYVKIVPDLKKNIVTYTVQITEVNGVKVDITGLLPIYASSPFGTRTHILSNPDSNVTVDGKPLTVLKDQLCLVGTQFDEYSILKWVHNQEKVPGVVEAVHHELVKIHGDYRESRQKHRIGLRQTGMPFTSILTAGHMLEVVFDILEVLRYLRFERRVLHRDISKGNVLYFEDSSADATSDVWSGGAKEAGGPEGLSLCFIKFLLGESKDPRKTSALLIDFNHAEHLRSKQGPEHNRVARTGTPIFIARAVELKGAVPPNGGFLIVPDVPMSPQCYETHHPDRIKKFPFAPKYSFEVSPDHIIPHWRQELDHDTESVFWLLLYWVIGAQPEGEQMEPINMRVWGSLMGSAKDRVVLLRDRQSLDDATHSFYQPLWPLLSQLAAIIDVDRHWLESSDPRNHPGYINEVFQRLILQFVLDHRNEEFMQRKVKSRLRRPETISENLSLSYTSGQMENSTKKQFSPDLSIQQGETKRSRINGTAVDTITEDASDEDEDQYVGMDEEE